MLGFFRSYVTALIIFFVIDIVWLVFIARKLYQKELGYIMRATPNWIAAIIFYLIFIGGLVFFVIHPALGKDSWTYALLAGMFFGLITYSTYDLTNLATLENWPLKITMIDLIWGSTLGAAVSALSFFVLKLFK